MYESAAVGSAVLQVTALDKDKGKNAEIVYSIESGILTFLHLPFVLKPYFNCRHVKKTRYIVGSIYDGSEF